MDNLRGQKSCFLTSAAPVSKVNLKHSTTGGSCSTTSTTAIASVPALAITCWAILVQYVYKSCVWHYLHFLYIAKMFPKHKRYNFIVIHIYLYFVLKFFFKFLIVLMLRSLHFLGIKHWESKSLLSYSVVFFALSSENIQYRPFWYPCSPCKSYSCYQEFNKTEIESVKTTSGVHKQYLPTQPVVFKC